MEGEKSRFLFVDSDSKNSLFWEMLIKDGFPQAEVSVCKTGFEALDLAERQLFDFCVASWEMEPMSGLIFMQKLKTVRKYRRVPFLIFSQLLSEDDLFLAREFGITNYLLKPFDKARVISKMTDMINEEKNLDSVQKNLRKIEDYINEGKVNEALKLIPDCLSKKGAHLMRAQCLYGDMWLKMTQLEKAEKAYKASLLEDPQHTPAKAGLSKVYMKLGRFDEGLVLAEELHKKSKFNLDHMVQLGEAYLDKGDEAKAEQVFHKLGEIDSTNKDAKAGLGKVAFQRGHMDLAAKFFKESGKGDELASYFNNMGIALINQAKRFDDGDKVYLNALKVLPDRAKSYQLLYNLGLAYKKFERHGDATKYFAESLIESPTFEKAYQALLLSVKEAKARNQKYDAQLVEKSIQNRQQPSGTHA